MLETGRRRQNTRTNNRTRGKALDAAVVVEEEEDEEEDSEEEGAVAGQHPTRIRRASLQEGSFKVRDSERGEYFVPEAI